MKHLWKTSLDKIQLIKQECIRIYNIIFEFREIDIIRSDYLTHKWISKKEIELLFNTDINLLGEKYLASLQDYNDLLEGFNLNAMRNYELLEHKFQNLIKK